MKNLDLKTLATKLMPVLAWLRRYQVITFIVVLVSIYSLLVFRINLLVSKQPNDSDVTTQLKAVNPPKIDPAVISKIQQLQDNSVEIKTLFNQARDNPFQE